VKRIILTLLILFFTFSASADTPENVTLELRLDAGEVYVDGDGDKKQDGQQFITETPDYPYVVTNDPLGIVSYSEALRVSYDNISTTEDKFSIVQTNGEFLLPFTESGYGVIEDREEEVKNRELLNLLNPSFSFPISTTQVVKVSYLFEYEIDSYQGRQENIRELTVRNKINGQKNIELTLRGS